MKPGITFSHEHIALDLSAIKNNDDCNFTNIAEKIEEFKLLYQLGVRNILDMTTIDLQRNIQLIEQVATATKINILVGTGFYTQDLYPHDYEQKTVEEIATIFIKEIVKGIENTPTKAAFIGEIGTSYQKITSCEHKTLMAAAIAHKQTGVAIFTHTSLGTMGLEQAKLLIAQGVDPTKIVIGHLDLCDNVEKMREILALGVYIAHDTIGKDNYVPEKNRIKNLQTLIREGYLNQLLISMDITRNSSLKIHGGSGYSYLLEEFLPKVGLSQSEIDYLLITNPQKVMHQMKQDLKTKLAVLLTSEIITEAIYQQLIYIYNLLNRNIPGIIPVENLEMIIIHLAMACSRVIKAQPVMVMNETIYEEISSDSLYADACAIYDSLTNLLPIVIPEMEKRFIVMHILNAMKVAQ